MPISRNRSYHLCWVEFFVAKCSIFRNRKKREGSFPGYFHINFEMFSPFSQIEKKEFSHWKSNDLSFFIQKTLTMILNKTMYNNTFNAITMNWNHKKEKKEFSLSFLFILNQIKKFEKEIFVKKYLIHFHFCMEVSQIITIFRQFIYL